VASRHTGEYNLAVKIRPRFRYGKRLAVCAFLVTLPSGGLVAQVADSTPQTITLQISSRLQVAVADSLHSATARVGEEFAVVLTQPLTDMWGTIEGGREGWITPLDVQIRSGRSFLFTLVAPLTLPVTP